VRLPEPIQASGLPIDVVQLGERVDERLADTPRVYPIRNVIGQHGAFDVLHDVERRPDQRLVIADREYRWYARSAGERAQDPGLAQHVVGAGRERRPGRASQHERRVAARYAIGDVGMPLADRGERRRPRAQAVRVEKLEQRLNHDQRHASGWVGILERLDDIVGGDWNRHQLSSPAAVRVDSPREARVSNWRAIVMRCTSLAPS